MHHQAKRLHRLVAPSDKPALDKRKLNYSLDLRKTLQQINEPERDNSQKTSAFREGSRMFKQQEKQQQRQQVLNMMHMNKVPRDDNP